MNELKINELNEHINDIRRSIDKTQLGMVEIGYHLKEIRDKALEQEKGYVDVWTLAKEEFGFNRSTTSRMMGIYEQYGVVEYGMPKLRGEYSAFNKGQLIEMLNVPEEIRQEIEPRATVKDIREIKKEIKTDEEPIPSEGDAVSEVIKAIFSREEYAKRFAKVIRATLSGAIDKAKRMDIRMAITESGSGVIKAAGVMVFFKEDKVVFLGKTKSDMGYIEFGCKIAEIFNCYYDDTTDQLIKKWEEVLGEEYPREPEPEPIKVKAVATSQKQEETKNKATKNDCKVEHSDEEIAKQEEKQEDPVAEVITIPTPEVVHEEEANKEPEVMEEQITEAAAQDQETEPEELEAVVEENKCECCEGDGKVITQGIVKMIAIAKYKRLLIKDYMTEDVELDIVIKHCPFCGREL